LSPRSSCSKYAKFPGFQVQLGNQAYLGTRQSSLAVPVHRRIVHVRGVALEATLSFGFREDQNPDRASTSRGTACRAPTEENLPVRSEGLRISTIHTGAACILQDRRTARSFEKCEVHCLVSKLHLGTRKRFDASSAYGCAGPVPRRRRPLAKESGAQKTSASRCVSPAARRCPATSSPDGIILGCVVAFL